MKSSTPPVQLKDQDTGSKQSSSLETEGTLSAAPPAFALTAGATAPTPAQTEAAQPTQLKEGDITHQGNAGPGKITARENDYHKDPKTGTESNDNFSLSYEGSDTTKDVAWVQFISATMVAHIPGKKPVYNIGTVEVTSGEVKYSNDKETHWFVDSASGANPYYEEKGVNERVPNKSTKIFDTPGGKSGEQFAFRFADNVNRNNKKDDPKASEVSKVTLILSFDSYLVKNKVSTYHVTWKATTEYNPTTRISTPINYDTTGGSPVKALPKHLKEILDKKHLMNGIQ